MLLDSRLDDAWQAAWRSGRSALPRRVGAGFFHLEPGPLFVDLGLEGGDDGGVLLRCLKRPCEKTHSATGFTGAGR